MKLVNNSTYFVETSYFSACFSAEPLLIIKEKLKEIEFIYFNN